MYTHLLVPTDGSKLSDKAVAHAIALAKSVHARVTVFYAAPDYPMPIYAEGVIFEPVSKREYAKQAAEGAKKVGVVKNRAGQLAFALERLDRALPASGKALLLLEYSDNRSWVEETVRPEIAGRYRQAEILVRPISLTTGVHTGPGTWGLAFLAEL